MPALIILKIVANWHLLHQFYPVRGKVMTSLSETFSCSFPRSPCLHDSSLPIVFQNALNFPCTEFFVETPLTTSTVRHSNAALTSWSKSTVNTFDKQWVTKSEKIRGSEVVQNKICSHAMLHIFKCTWGTNFVERASLSFIRAHNKSW